MSLGTKLLVIILLLLLGLIVHLAYFFTVIGVESSAVSERNSDDVENPRLGSIHSHLFWFVQITDIHISMYFDPGRATDLIRFCDEYLHVIQPDLVVASGDLTDGKFADHRGSGQYDQEWKRYHEVVSVCRKYTPTWLDLRGNHDSFDVPTVNNPNDFYRKYSVQGPEHPVSYSYTHQKPFGNYTFIAMDACLEPGPKRPFNFFGYLNSKQRQLVEQYREAARGSNMTFWLGHYPTSTILTEGGHPVRDVMSGGIAYLCGHLHTLGGVVSQMYTRHKTGTLELELGDWRDNRRFRVLAVDHDILSFTDAVLGTWPIILITNPKSATYVTAGLEATERTQHSTHIRFLIFTPGSVNNAEVYIDDINIGKGRHVEGSLYVTPWDPSKYTTGIHSLRIVVQDSLQNRQTVEQPFSLDGSRDRFPLMSRLILMVDWFDMGYCLFIFLVFVYVMVLFLLWRCNNVRVLYVPDSIPFLRPFLVFFNRWLYRTWLVARTRSLYFLLTGFILYIAIGPWFVGEMLTGHTGVVFVWGIYIGRDFLPGTLTYYYGIGHIVIFNVPVLMFLGYMMQYWKEQRNKHWLYRLRHIYIPFSVIVLLQAYLTKKDFPAAYGPKSLLSPVRLGSVLLTFLLYHLGKNNAIKLHDSSHRS
ncbi:hypothetical protein ScPMuIL_013605 [Solemya velum]